MKHLTLRTNFLWIGLATSLLALNILASFTVGFDVPTAILGVLWLCLLPGWLITRIFRLKTSNTAETVVYSAGLSIFTTLLIGLGINFILPLAGNHQPLSLQPLLVALDAFWIGLISLARLAAKTDPPHISLIKPKLSDGVIGVGGLSIITLAVGGAISLNNQGTELISWSALVLATGYLAAVIIRRDKLRESTLLFAIFSVGLSVLLMTSLRGWYTTGHDIQREFFVFLTTLQNHHWSIGNASDAYNACLSITIFPTIIHELTGIDPAYVFKVVFQTIFALVPVLIYLIARRLTPNRLIAILASIYFLAFPTFFGDMPMLGRQELAFVFLALVLLTFFNDTWSIRRRRILISILGLGVVLSHYSTNYTMIFLFGLFIALRFGFQRTEELRRSLIRLVKRMPRKPRRTWQAAAPVGILTIGSLILASFLWSSQFTRTGDNLPRIIASTIESLKNGFKGDKKSSDTAYSLVAAGNLSDQQRLQAYLSQSVPNTRQEFGEEVFFPTLKASAYQPTATTLQNATLTPVGQFFQKLGLPVADFNTAVRQGSARLLQILLLIGVIVLFVAKPLKRRPTSDFRLLQLSSVGLLAAIVALPVLSAEYGLLRAFQQTLMLSGITIAIASIWIIPKRFARLRVVLPAALALTFFASSTGVITTLLGGYPPQLHLASAGKYYNLYYPHATEQAAIKWTAETTSHNTGLQIIQTSLQFDRYGWTAGDYPKSLTVSTNIYPDVIHRDSYVLVGETVTRNRQAIVYYNGDLITYRYPLEFLDANKDLIYSSNGARVYK